MNSNYKKLRAATAAGLLGVLLASNAHAGLVTWTLRDVTFSDGGTATGTFEWDADGTDAAMAQYDPWYAGGAYGDYGIQTSAGVGLGWNYTSADGNNIGYFTNLWGDTGLAWAGYAYGTPYLDLIFSTVLTDAGGTVSVVDGYECSDVTSTVCREITGGEVTTEAATAVPEPGSLALVAAALLGLAGTCRRKGGGFR